MTKILVGQNMWWAQGRKWLPKTGWASSNAAPSILPKSGWVYAHPAHPLPPCLESSDLQMQLFEIKLGNLENEENGERTL